MRRVTILGSTGSIGMQALDVVRESRGALAVRALAARRSVEKLASQALEFHPEIVAMADPAAARDLKRKLGGLGTDGPRVLSGAEGVLELAADCESDVLLNALVGSSGLLPSLAALDAGVPLALANKESLVMAGPLVMAKAREKGPLVPVDSEHSSLFRCMLSEDASRVRSVTITASGGAFRNWPLERMRDATPDQALRHPVWNMGSRVTIDSATMMNKALEIIEAQHLFDIEPSRIRVVVHPQAYVHGLVELGDGTLLAHLGPPDMKVAIAYALYYPDCPEAVLPGAEALDLAAIGSLSFEKPDCDRFPCLALGYKAAAEGGTTPAVLNAADEVAVEGFLKGLISFPEIAEVVSEVIGNHEPEKLVSVEQALAADRWGKARAAELIGR